MRLVAMICLAYGVCGCASSVKSEATAGSAEIAMATEPRCDQPGVRLDSVRHVGASQAMPLLSGADRVAVPAGRYEISVACQNPINETRGACVFWGHPNEYPTYKMRLRSGVRYSFQCYEIGGDVGYRISEGDL